MSSAAPRRRPDSPPLTLGAAPSDCSRPPRPVLYHFRGRTLDSCRGVITRRDSWAKRPPSVKVVPESRVASPHARLLPHIAAVFSDLESSPSAGCLKPLPLFSFARLPLLPARPTLPGDPRHGWLGRRTRETSVVVRPWTSAERGRAEASGPDLRPGLRLWRVSVLPRRGPMAGPPD